MRKTLFCISSLVALQLFFTTAGYADDSDVVISEVMFNSACEASNSTGECTPGTSNEVQFEWVEVFNRGGTSVDLTQWRICDESPGTGHADCDSLSGSIDAGEYLVIAHNNDSPNYALQDEFDNYSATVVTADTLFLHESLGSNGVANGGDTIFLVTDESTCGSSMNLPCVSDCVSWDGTNTCASLIDGTNRDFLPGSDGHDDTTLTTNEGDGQSIVNIEGTWYQSGPDTNADNQASPYRANTAEGGSPTAVTLSSLSVRSSANKEHWPVVDAISHYFSIGLAMVASVAGLATLWVFRNWSGA